MISEFKLCPIHTNHSQHFRHSEMCWRKEPFDHKSRFSVDTKLCQRFVQISVDGPSLLIMNFEPLLLLLLLC